MSGDPERVRGRKYHQLLANTSDTSSSFVLCDPDAALSGTSAKSVRKVAIGASLDPNAHGADVCVECLYTAVILVYEAGLIDRR
jgi:hypothetical protein